LSSQQGLFGATEEAPHPKDVDAGPPPSVSSVTEPTRRGAEAATGPVDAARLRVMFLGAPSGSRYCFDHDAFEFEVAIYMVGRRAMFLCRAAAAALGGELCEGVGKERT